MSTFLATLGKIIGEIERRTYYRVCGEVREWKIGGGERRVLQPMRESVQLVKIGFVDVR